MAGSLIGMNNHMQSLVKIRFLAPAFAVLLASVALLVEYLTLSQRLEARELYYAQQSLQSLALQTQSTVDRELRHGELELLDQIISQLNFHPLMTQASLADASDKILVSTQKLLQDLNLSDLEPTIDTLVIDSVRQSKVGTVISSPSDYALKAIYPIALPSAGSLAPSSGLLIIDFNYKDRVDVIQREIQSATLQSSGTILALVFLVAVAVHFGITRRVQRVILAAEQYLHGDVSKRVRLTGHDEIGLISQAFDQVADSAEESKEAIRELNRTLERRVEVRTAEVQASKKELQAILDTAADAVIAINEDAAIVEFNPAAEKIFGWLKSDILGKNVKVLMPQRIAQHHDEYLRNYGGGEGARVIGQEREIAGLRSNGTEFPFELTVNTTQLNDKKLLIAVGRDVTERRQAETDLLEARQALLKAENMAALGNLVAGVAHEINTPVGVGVTAATHLRELTVSFEQNYRNGKMRRSDLDDFISNSFQTSGIIETNLHRASDLIRSFKQVAVDQTGGEERELNLAEYIDEIILSLRPKLKNRPITVVQEVPPNILLRVKAGALSQILTNLITNSLAHGFEDGRSGKITLGAKYDGHDLVFEYKDDGIGMESDTAKRIFEPFFTTKRGSGGSGLGMHIVFNLVTNVLGGSILCQSSPGHGAMYTIKVPIGARELQDQN